MARKKKEYVLDNNGGAIVLPKRMIDSDQFKRLPANSQILAVHMQSHWSYYKAIDFGWREARDILHCGITTAGRALKALEAAQFIVEEEPAFFINACSKGNRPKSWSLTWMPFQKYGTSPTKLWEKPLQKINSTYPPQERKSGLLSTTGAQMKKTSLIYPPQERK